ncbi:MAG: DMT family transporter [Flavobacteriaceae bacterium]|nr:DMT family transporter [Flavobacteriaceae bacterium]
MPNAKFKNHLHLNFIVFIWGFTAVLGALISIGATSLVWYRMGMSVAVLLIYAFWVKVSLKQSAKAIVKFSFVGFLIAIHWMAFFYAIKISNVSITLAAMSTGALFTTFLEPLFYRKKIVWYEVFFALIAMLGLLIIYNVQTTFTTGLVFGLIAAFLAALFAVFNSQLVKKHSAYNITFYELLAGFLLMTLILSLNKSFTNLYFFKLSFSDFGYIFILASVCTAYTMVASTDLLRKMSPFTMMLTINLEPVYGILLALVILGDSEKMHPKFYLGAALILVSILLNAILKLYPKILVYKKR